ncbi:MAG: DUF3017 domain-containing protein [Ruaniaceae bacterium]|nr:DUF3017 domain-containing protein [Ruaniaceae bacterium]
MKTLRRPFSIGIVLLLAGVVWLGWAVNPTVATYVLAAGLVGLAAARIFLPPKDTLNSRGRNFDVVILVGFAAALAVLAPWGLAQLPS